MRRDHMPQKSQTKNNIINLCYHQKNNDVNYKYCSDAGNN